MARVDDVSGLVAQRTGMNLQRTAGGQGIDAASAHVDVSARIQLQLRAGLQQSALAVDVFRHRHDCIVVRRNQAIVVADGACIDQHIAARAPGRDDPAVRIVNGRDGCVDRSAGDNGPAVAHVENGLMHRQPCGRTDGPAVVDLAGDRELCLRAGADRAGIVQADAGHGQSAVPGNQSGIRNVTGRVDGRHAVANTCDPPRRIVDCTGVHRQRTVLAQRFDRTFLVAQSTASRHGERSGRLHRTAAVVKRVPDQNGCVLASDHAAAAVVDPLDVQVHVRTSRHRIMVDQGGIRLIEAQRAWRADGAGVIDCSADNQIEVAARADRAGGAVGERLRAQREAAVGTDRSIAVDRATDVDKRRLRPHRDNTASVVADVHGVQQQAAGALDVAAAILDPFGCIQGQPGARTDVAVLVIDAPTNREHGLAVGHDGAGAVAKTAGRQCDGAACPRGSGDRTGAVVDGCDVDVDRAMCSQRAAVVQLRVILQHLQAAAGIDPARISEQHIRRQIQIPLRGHSAAGVVAHRMPRDVDVAVAADQTMAGDDIRVHNRRAAAGVDDAAVAVVDGGAGHAEGAGVGQRPGAPCGVQNRTR